MTERIIDVSHLNKSFGDVVAVHDLGLEVKKGEIFGFLGPNGSGKTTTIRMLCGLLTPDSGEGSSMGYDIIKETDNIKKHTGYMTQKFSFYTDLTIEENLEFVARVFRIKNRKSKITQIINEFGMRERKNQLVGYLSGGWKQRVALAACLIHKPRLLLLDEPTAGVDPIARREFWDKIHLLSEQGVTVFISTHYMDEGERCTRLAYIDEGSILLTGKVLDVIQSTQLSTWMLKGVATTDMLQKVKKIKGLSQAALFGNQIHVSGKNVAEIEAELQKFAEKYNFTWQRAETTLEDAYIYLVNKPSGAKG